MAYRRFLKPRWLVIIPVLLVVAIAAACGDDATPASAPTPVPVDVAAIAAQVQAAVKGTVEEALKAAPTGPAPVSAAEIQTLVETAVAAAAPKGASTADIKSLVDTALKAAITPGVTKEDVEGLVTKAVADAAAAAEPGVSANEVQQIIEAALAALPTPVPPVVVQPTAVPPRAEPTATPAPPPSAEPTGVLNIGFKEFGTFIGHPILTSTAGNFIGPAIGERLVAMDVEGNFLPMLATEWSLAPDNLTWTFKLQKGVQFSKGYGEMTSEDVIWSYETYGADEAINARQSTFKRLWGNEAGSVKALDDYTIEVNTGTVQYDMLFLASNSTIGWIVSKKQTDDVGVEAASTNISTTGTFEIVDHATGQFWKMKAVEDHWRKTPFFAEMMWFEILEESTRVANFQVGRLDTMNMDLDSLPSIQRVADVKFMRVEGGAIENVALYGQYYTNVGTADQKPGYDPSLAYVSSNPDLNSDEWAQAVMVRKAMTMAIDRQLIVDTIIKGEGTPGTLWGFDQWGAANFDADIAKGWGFDPAAAKQLLVDAGYPNGFDVTITPLIRNVPGEVDACHAAGQFWEDIGINVELKSLPFSAFVPTIAAREYSGVGCQGTNGRLDPLSLMVIFRHDSFFTAGLDHPKITELADKALAIVDTEERNVVTKEIARFFFDNALNFGLYGLNVIWPLGAKIDDWSDKMEYADPKMISRFEWVPHR